MFLITGTGRSGTKYISQVLRRTGLDVGHERRGKDGVVSSTWLVHDPQGYPAYHAQDRPAKFDTILHQVRSPLLSISSLTTSTNASWEYNARHVPIDIPTTPTQKLRSAALYWLYWNQKALSLADYSYRIENLAESWLRISELLHIDTPYLDAVSGISKTTNSRRHKSYSLKDLAEVLSDKEHDMLLSLSSALGYEAT
jgi:hypothetical protein